MNDERKKVLELLSAGKISVEEAERLLAAMEDPAAGSENTKPKYLRVLVEPKSGAAVLASRITIAPG